MKRIATTLLTLGMLTTAASAFADGVYQTLPFTQNWTNIALISVSDDWSGVPGIIGFRGDGLTAATAVDPQTVLTDDVAGVVDVNANNLNPNTFTTGGVTEFDALADPVVALQGSGTARAPYIQIHIDATGKQNLIVGCSLRDVDGSADNSVQPIAVHFRVGTTGLWTNVPAAFVADASTGPSLAVAVTPVFVPLPAAVNGQSQVQIRIMTTDAVGSDEWIGIDNITVEGTDIPTATAGRTWGAVKSLYR